MFISETGLNLIKSFEGCKLQSYDDYNNKTINANDKVIGTLTIGYGHIEGVYKGQTITQGQADELLKSDMVKYCNMVQALINDGTISFQVNQNMFDSLTSFCYNLGQGNLIRLCKNRNANEVVEHMTAYINKGSVWEQGLLRRRNAEKDLFLKPCENVSRETLQNEGGSYMSKIYKNGSTKEIVYSDSDCTIVLGSLSPREICTCIYEFEGKAVVLYKVNGTNNEKIGFVKWTGGIQ